MSSASGRMTMSNSASVTKPMSSERLKKRELITMTLLSLLGLLVLGGLLSFANLEREQPLRPHHQDGDDRKQGDDLGHRARQEELQGRLRLRDGEGGRDGADQA